MDHLSPDLLGDVELVVVGSPTYFQAVARDVRSVIKSLPKHSLRHKRVAAFDTSRKTWKPLMLMTAAHGILSRLRRLGGKRVLGPETFLVSAHDSQEEDSDTSEVDLLFSGEFERAGDWAQRILENLSR
jgi:flavodoxin